VACLGARFRDKRVVLFCPLLKASGGFGQAPASTPAAANVARFLSGAGAIVLDA
jgi:hypothetical protein